MRSLPRLVFAALFGAWLAAGCAPTGSAGGTGTAGSGMGTAGPGNAMAGAGGGATSGRVVARLREPVVARRPEPVAAQRRHGWKRDAGSGGSARGGTTGTGGAAGAVANGDDFVSNVQVTVHATTNTILVVTWTQVKAADTVALEFSFAGSGTMKSRAAAGATGAHRDVVLGVPGSTAVTLRIVSTAGGVDYKTKDYPGTTGAIPSGMPKPMILAYDATRASPRSLPVRLRRGFGGRLHRRHLLLPLHVLALHHGPAGPRGLVLGGPRPATPSRRSRASRATASTSCSRSGPPAAAACRRS